MSRILFSIGSRGDIIRHVQSQLNLHAEQIDGRFGKITAQAMTGFQTANGLPPSGEMDVDTWGQLMQVPVPEVKERALQLTAAFEGHGFSLAQGNFDGAGITWGIIGFTMKGGELGRLIKKIEAQHPGLVANAFGASAPRLFQILAAPPSEQIDFANSISLGVLKATLAEPWLSGFRRLGEQPEVQQLQLSIADQDYFRPALSTAARFNLKTELGIALAFDIHVQNGGIRDDVAQQIRGTLAAHPSGGELDVRVAIANAVADGAKNVQFREDVRQRKLTVATGAGSVHGDHYVLRNWGLAEVSF